MSDELVRVRVEDREFSTGRSTAETFGFEVLDEPAVREDGRVRGETRVPSGRPSKPKRTPEEAAAEKNATPAANPKEKA